MPDDRRPSDHDEWLTFAVNEINKAFGSLRALADDADSVIAAARAALARETERPTGTTQGGVERLVPSTGAPPPASPEGAGQRAAAGVPEPEPEVPRPSEPRSAPVPAAVAPVGPSREPTAVSQMARTGTDDRRRRRAAAVGGLVVAAVLLATVAIALTTRPPNEIGTTKRPGPSPALSGTGPAPTKPPSSSFPAPSSQAPPTGVPSTRLPSAGALPPPALSPSTALPPSAPPAAPPSALRPPAALPPVTPPGAAPPSATAPGGSARLSACTGAGWEARRLAAALATLSYPYGRLGIRVVAAPARAGVLATGRRSTRVITAYVRPCAQESVALLAAAVTTEMAQLIDACVLTNQDRMRWMLQRGAPPGTAWIPDGALDYASVFTLWQVGPGYWRSELPPPPATQLTSLERWYAVR